MEYNKDKVDEAVLALLYLNIIGDEYGAHVWKSFDWGAMDRLYEKGYISDPKSKAKAVFISEEGIKRAEELFRYFFVEE